MATSGTQHVSVTTFYVFTYFNSIKIFCKLRFLDLILYFVREREKFPRVTRLGRSELGITIQICVTSQPMFLTSVGNEELAFKPLFMLLQFITSFGEFALLLTYFRCFCTYVCIHSLICSINKYFRAYYVLWFEYERSPTGPCIVNLVTS